MSNETENKVTIFVDDVPIVATPGENLLQACLSEGLELPYFCWHPALGSVGACRQCAVIQYADEEDERGRLTMACMTPVSDGVRISINADSAEKFRANVIEWLMENHPHDCPVCEEGGECHLQDMTVMTGHTKRRYRGRKRTWENQYLGPFLNHEMNRCITCYRCVRFYRDYAGGTDLAAFGSRSRVYFGREEDGVLENEFSGNLVEVCPTGVFTDKPFSASYTRKWDLRSAPSICAGCAVGCNTFVSERSGRLKRVHNRYHGELNGYFLCDRGRFGAGYVNSPERIRQVGERASDDVFDEISRERGIERLAEIVRSGNAIGIGSPRASLETNAALKQLVGEENFCNGMSHSEAEQVEILLSVYRATSAKIASISDVEAADAILILGEDVTNTAPRIALALRQAVRNESFNLAQAAGIPEWQDAGVRSHGRQARNPLCQATLLPTRLDDVTSTRANELPDGIADLGLAIAARIRGEREAIPSGMAVNRFVADAAAALMSASRPLVISGTGAGSKRVIEATGAVVAALERRDCEPALLLVAPEVNSIGCAMLGSELDLETALERAANGSLIVAENDLFRRVDPNHLTQVLGNLKDLVVADSLATSTASAASLVLPAATFVESTGTVVNLETRAQRFYAAMRPENDVAPCWRWFVDGAEAAGRNDLGWAHVDDVLAAASSRPGLQGLAAPAGTEAQRRKVPRETHRFSGRTAMTAQVNIHEPRTPEDAETPLSWSMEGQHQGQPSTLLPFVWAPGWNSNQSVFKFQQEVGGAAAGGDPGSHLLTDRATGSYPVPGSGSTPSAVSGFTLAPLQTIFGTDELSACSPPIAQRAPTPFAVMNPADAERLGLDEGGGVRCAELPHSLQIRLDPAIASGSVGIAAGLSGTCWLPAQPVRLEPDPDYRPPGDSTDVIARG